MAQVAVTLGNSRDGGVLMTIQDVDADQVNKVLFVPEDKVWKVLSVTAVVTPSGDAGNRQIQLECQEADAYGVLFTVDALNVQIASSVERYVFSHQLVAIHIGRERRFRGQDVLEFVASRPITVRCSKRHLRHGKPA